MKVVLLFGGRTAEHEVSILSARSVAAAAPKRLELIPICIAKDGRFVEPKRSALILEGKESSRHGHPGFSFETWVHAENVDIALPMIHGTGGEDGSLQGYLEIVGLPYAGSGVTASALAMDKVHMKQVFAAAKLPMADFVAVQEHDWKSERDRVRRSINNALRLPYFVKPANTGSSVGVVKVKNDADLGAAIEHAFRFDEKILIERGIEARELEISILGNESPEASVPGEIVPAGEFYDYKDKYVDNAAQLIIPAKLPKDKQEEMRRHAIAAFRAVGAFGFARVDFFLERGTNRLYVNEINTIPGFTQFSMYAKMWEATELKYPRLIERIIELGVERGRARAKRAESTMSWFNDVESLVKRTE